MYKRRSILRISLCLLFLVVAYASAMSGYARAQGATGATNSNTTPPANSNTTPPANSNTAPPVKTGEAPPGGPATEKPVESAGWLGVPLSSAIALLFTALLYGLAVLAAGWKSSKYSLSPVYLTAQNKHGTASLSKLQIFFFTLLVFGLLVYILARTGKLSGVSKDILLLLGISAVGAAGSAVTDAIKTRLSFENWSWLRNRGWLTAYEKGTGQPSKPERALWSDLLKTDDDFDIYKFQLLTISSVVAFALVAHVVSVSSQANISLANITIDQNILALLGLSNVVHIGGKAVGTSFAELNDKAESLRTAEAAWVSQVVPVVVTTPPQDKLAEAIKAAPDKYESYITLAREAARMLQSLYGMEGTKFKTPDIKDAELMPEFP